MLRKVVQHELVERIDEMQEATTPEEGQEIAQEVFQRCPELAQYATPANISALEVHLAAQPLTVVTFERALRNLAAAGKLRTVAEVEAEEQEARAEVEKKLKQQAEAEKAREKEPSEAERFAAFYEKSSPAQIKAKAGSNRAFNEWLRKRIREETEHPRTDSPSAAPPKHSGPVEPIALTAQEYHSLPASVVSQRMRNPAFVAAVEKLVAEGKL